MARKSGLPIFHEELKKLLGIKAAPAQQKVPPTNVTQPLPMPQVDLSKAKDFSAISTFKNGVLTIPAGKLDVGELAKILAEWKKENIITLDMMGNVNVYIEHKPDGSVVLTSNVPGQAAAKTHISKPKVAGLGMFSMWEDEYAENPSIEAPDPLTVQLQQELEQQLKNSVGAQLVGKVHDEYIFAKPEYLGEWAPPEESPVTKEDVDAYAKNIYGHPPGQVPEGFKISKPGIKASPLYGESFVKKASQTGIPVSVDGKVIGMVTDLKFNDIQMIKEEQKLLTDPKELPNYMAQELAFATKVISEAMEKPFVSAEDQLYNSLTQLKPDEDSKIVSEFMDEMAKMVGLPKSYLDGSKLGELSDGPDTVAEPEEVELVELTFSGLTKKEAEAMLKQVKKSEKPVLVSKKKMKDIGTGSKAIVKWEFESSSMVSNGTPVKYIAQLNEDGTTSCQCRGWTQGSAKSAEGRFCKHTKALEEQYDMKVLYKRWKRGEPLGEDFVQDGQQAPELKPIGTSAAATYTSKRIVEI